MADIDRNFEKVATDLADAINKAKDTLRSSSSEILAKIIKATPKDTGDARQAWSLINASSESLTFQNPLAYAIPLEYGSALGSKPWPSTGPKTVEMSGRVYSSQAPGGIVINTQLDEFVDKMVSKVIDEAIR